MCLQKYIRVPKLRLRRTCVAFVLSSPSPLSIIAFVVVFGTGDLGGLSPVVCLYFVVEWCALLTVVRSAMFDIMLREGGGGKPNLCS